MMGRQSTDQRRFFYDFCLEDHVPADHLLRRIDGLLDLREVREKLQPHYSPVGRPSVDPELMMRMLIVGYCFGIRSERRLCQGVVLPGSQRTEALGWRPPQAGSDIAAVAHDLGADLH